MTTKTWVGGAVGSIHSWTGVGNWGSGVLPPVAGDIANITTPGTTSVDIASGIAAATTVNVTNSNQLFVDGTGKLNVSGTILSGGATGAANTSTIFVWNSAVLSANNASIGGNVGGAGVIDVDQGGTFNVTNNINVTSVSGGGAGTLQIHNGGKVTAASVSVGNGATNGSIIIGSAGIFGEVAGTLTTGSVALNTIGSSLKFNTSDTAGFGGVISGSGFVTISSAGQTTTLTGANSYTGGTTISGGRVSINNGNALGTGLINLSTTNAALSTTGNFSLANSIAMQGASNTIAAANATTLTLTGVIGFSSSAGVVHFGTAAETGKIIFSDSNLFWSINKSFAIDGGTLVAGNGQLSTLLTNSLALGTSIAVGATLDLNGQSIFQINNLTGAGNVVNNGLTSSSFRIFNSSTQTFSGVIGDGISAVAVNVSGVGTTIWSGHNTFTGATYLSNGTLKAGIANALSAASAIGIDGTLDLGGFDQSIGKLTGTGMVVNTGGAAVLSETNAIDTFFSGSITGQISLDKLGAGTLTLSSANTYTGATIIDQGILQLGPSGSIANSQNVQLHAGTNLYFGNIAGSTIKDLFAVGGAANVFTGGKALTITGETGPIGAITFNGTAGADTLTINLNSTLSDFSLAPVLFTNWGGASDTITLNGNGLDNILTGSSASEIMNGGAGNDTLIGGLGNSFDTLTGGIGNDTFIFNASEIQSGQSDIITDYTRDVNGVGDTISLVGVYAGYVSAYVLGGVTNIGYGNGVINNSILLSNAGTNLIVINGYTDLAHALNHNLAGGYQFVSEATNQAAHAWSYYVTTYDATGLADYANTYNDNGTRDAVDYDNLNSVNWTSYSSSFDAGNNLYYRITFFDDGTYYTTHLDNLNNQPWTKYDESYDAQNRMDYRVVTNDDNSLNVTHLDRLNNQPWKQYVDVYDPQNNLDNRVTTNDDNSLFVTHLDHNNDQTWTQYIDIYNTLGQHTFESFTFDTGQPVITKDITYDNAGQLWDQDIYEYNAAHQQTLHYRVMDDLSIVILP